ncbi:MAG: hypothetical protein AAF921_14070 [Cyanobacteria bacterium P01_D01_bin.44]
MNIALLVSFLAPCLPYLMKLGDKAAEKVAEKVGEKTLDQVGKIWTKLRPNVEAKEAACEAAEDVAQSPDDEMLRTVLQVQLTKILEQNPDLAAEVAQLLKEAEAEAETSGTHIEQTVTGNQNQVIGQMSGNAKVIGSVEGNVTM